MGRKTAGTDRDKKKKIKWRPHGCLSGKLATAKRGGVTRPKLLHAEKVYLIIYLIIY